MDITLRQFEVLAAVADSGSFTLAAKKLGVSQPSVSETVRRIEDELGFAVFHRTTRTLVLSHDGAHVVATAREMIRNVRAAYELISTRMGGTESRIGLAALPSLISSVIAPALKEFRFLHSRIAVDVHDSNQERALDLVSDGIVDMAFVSEGSLRRGLNFEVLAADRFLLLCPLGHRLADRPSVHWGELADENFIALSPTSSVRKITDAAFLQAATSCVPHYELEQVPSAAALAEAGLGVAALPEYSFSMFAMRSVVAVPLVSPEIVRRIGVVTRGHRPLGPGNQAFLKLCRETLAMTHPQETKRRQVGRPS